jgi:hypothetical protein
MESLIPIIERDGMPVLVGFAGDDARLREKLVHRQ